MNIALLLAVAALSASAQQATTVDGLVIQLGLMSAEKAVHAEGHAQAHPRTFPSGSQHLLVTLAEEKTGRRIGDAEVALELVDPKGRTERKTLLHTSAAGMPDYSELFVFGWSGTYTVRLDVKPWAGAKPVKASFTVHHQP